MPFVNPVVTGGGELVLDNIHSPNYVISVSGWTINKDGSAEFNSATFRGDLSSPGEIDGEIGWAIRSNGTAQFDTVQVLNSLGADNVDTGTLTINGEDFNDIISPNADGGIGWDTKSSGTHMGDTSGGTELLMAIMSFGPVVSGRLYRMTIQGHLSGTVADDAYDFRVRYTNNGSTPTLASALLAGSLQRINIPTVTSTHFSMMYYYSPGNDYDQIQQALTLQRAGGTGLAFIYGTDSNRRMEWLIEDCGVYSDISAGGALQQIAYHTTPPIPDPPPVQTYTKSYSLTWSRSFDEDLGIRSGDDTNDMYQGYISSTHGDTRSLGGFDYTQIMSDTSGATVTGCWITFTAKHVWNSGVLIKIGVHDYTSKPTTWSGARVDENVATHDNTSAGSPYKVSLGATYGDKFRTGVAKGIAFGPANSSSASAYFAYLYGETDSRRPVLTITYKK